MPKPLVFISHSAKEPLAREVLDELYDRLEPDFEVLLDKYRLEANDPWQQELYTWMGQCQAAVILFSKKALKSQWVLQEATILRWRRALDENFVVIPIIIPPVKNKDLDKNQKFAPLSLNVIQMLAAGSASDVADRVVKRLEPLKKQGEVKTGLKKLEDKIASNLFELETRNPQALVEAAAKLGLTLPWKSDSGYSRQLARALLSADFAHVTEAVLVMAPHFSDYRIARDVIDRLSSFWVDPQAAARIAEMYKLPQQQRAVCVNGAIFKFTPGSYLSRARADLVPWVTAKVNLPKGYEEQPDLQMQMIEEDLVKQIIPLIGLPEGEDEDLFSGLGDLLVKGRELKEALFILVPKELSEDVVEQLRKKFFRFTFFLLTDDQTVDQKKLEVRYIELLEPKLNPETEITAAKLFFDAHSEVNRLKPT